MSDQAVDGGTASDADELNRTQEALDRGFAAVDAAAAAVKRKSKAALEDRSRSVLAIGTLVVWAGCVVAVLWVILSSSSADQFICSLPGDNVGADYTGICTNKWTTALDQARDLVSLFVIPVVTLSLGYYFGRNSRDG